MQASKGNISFKEFVEYIIMNTTYQSIMVSQHLVDNFNTKEIFVYGIVLILGFVCYIVYFFKLSNSMQIHPGLNSIFIWLQLIIIDAESDVILGYVNGLIMGQYLQMQKFKPKQKNLAWKNIQNVVTHVFLIAMLAYNVITRSTKIPQIVLTGCGVLIVFSMMAIRYYQKLQHIRRQVVRQDTPLNSILQVNSIMIQSKPKEEILNQTKQSSKSKWDQLIDKGLDNWYFTVSSKKEPKLIDIDQMNSPMEMYLCEKQLTGLELLNRIKTFHFSNSTNYSSNQQVQIDQDQTLIQILQQWFEDEFVQKGIEKKNKQRISFFNEVDDLLLSPNHSQRSNIQFNSKFVRLNTLQSKKKEKSYVKGDIKHYFEKQPSIISQINNLPESRVKLDQSSQSIFAKSDLSLLMTSKQNKNKSYMPCVLTLEDNSQIYLSVSIVTFINDSSQESQTAVIIENNHHQVMQYIQLINLQARLNITHNFIQKQSQENSKLLKTLIDEKIFLISKQQALSTDNANSMEKTSQKFSNEHPPDVETTKRHINLSPQPVHQIASGFSFCIDNNQMDSMKELKDNQQIYNTSNSQLRQSSLSFQNNRDKQYQNTLPIPQQIKITRQLPEVECDTPLTLICEQPSSNIRNVQQITRHLESQLQLIQSLIYKGFTLVNGAYNYMDFFGDNQNLQSIKPNNFKLDQVVSNILNMLKFHENVQKYQIKLTLDSRLQNVIMSSNKRKVKQLFTNLIINAIEAIQTHSATNQIIIELSDDIMVKSKSRQNQIYVTITDTGQGLKQDQLDLHRILEARFGLLSVENTLNQLGPGAQSFKIRNLRYKEDITASGCQAFFKLNRNINSKQKNPNEELSILGFKLDESQYMERCTSLQFNN